ncbi:bifunctional 2-acylglycerophosphoethanolamine acyltransferase/acyl-ACP synthetase, partial [Pectobacterium brasiliense]|nr:bifunctional 2-acylglycerophosphoethanolamine acyltransferase/acyl-ACP synthetase [Pectobacterium brasiliense]
AKSDSSKCEALVLFKTDNQINRDAMLPQAPSSGVPELAVPRDISYVKSLTLLWSGNPDCVTLRQMSEEPATIASVSN